MPEPCVCGCGACFIAKAMIKRRALGHGLRLLQVISNATCAASQQPNLRSKHIAALAITLRQARCQWAHKGAHSLRFNQSAHVGAARHLRQPPRCTALFCSFEADCYVLLQGGLRNQSGARRHPARFPIKVSFGTIACLYCQRACSATSPPWQRSLPEDRPSAGQAVAARSPSPAWQHECASPALPNGVMPAK